jgi:hypothetical protein
MLSTKLLWTEWEGEGFDSLLYDSAIFYKHEQCNVLTDKDVEVLARVIQQTGYVDSLYEGRLMVQNAELVTGFCGYIDSDTILTACDSTGMTYYGDSVDSIIPVTWVEVRRGDN